VTADTNTDATSSNSATVNNHPSSSSSPILPFTPPTSKAGHENHDVRSLAPDQAAFYANEYGKVEQAEEITRTLKKLRYKKDEVAKTSGDNENATMPSNPSSNLHPVVLDVVVHHVGVHDAHELVRSLQEQQRDIERQHAKTHPHDVPQLVVLNLCDGTEDDGYPGITVARALEETEKSNNIASNDATVRSDSAAANAIAAVTSASPLPPLPHTGADPSFFETTTDKRSMKECFIRDGVRTASHVDLSDIDTEVDVDENSMSEGGVHATLVSALAPSPTLVYPLIIKPTCSYSSCGLTYDSVVHSPEAALKQAQLIRRKLGNVIAEEFVEGREFSMLLVGDWNGGKKTQQSQDGSHSHIQPPSSDTSSSQGEDPYPHLRCYPASERVFSSSLPSEHRFLTFEQNYPTSHTELHTWWNGLDLSTEQGRRDQAAMERLAKAAYVACRGRSYGRIDIRQRASTGEFFILEVNSLPGLSGELDSSVGSILHHAAKSNCSAYPSARAVNFARFLYSILHLAVEGELDEQK